MSHLPYEEPWPRPRLEDCYFYHAMDLPDGTTVGEEWDLRGRFDHYVGGVDLKGKTVLDIGTASGFMAFEAEAAGAACVAALDARSALDRDILPFGTSAHQIDIQNWLPTYETGLTRMKNGFWYLWHARGSKVRISYLNLRELALVEDRFDVVMAGALLEHLADPVGAIGLFARLTKETLILPFTALNRSPFLTLSAITSWRNPQADVTWWAMSRPLVKQLFDNLGFDLKIVPCEATVIIGGQRRQLRRHTLIGTRR